MEILFHFFLNKKAGLIQVLKFFSHYNFFSLSVVLKVIQIEIVLVLNLCEFFIFFKFFYNFIFFLVFLLIQTNNKKTFFALVNNFKKK